ncbi:AAA family ATPase [Nannocystis punicea]|uniref:AAA family ATPase n=1 Tax=Nannocystis punicea TaxID=2995304 RepID=A0ABY7H0X5_9BACT|nr:AAA family ATPase [Nannocystis poenicansa]WAS92892.1 AAA family ATPase [Nannocystis poenicansa]
MTLEVVTFQNFTVFADARVELCPGINVLIGTNGTGKSHAMKAMYALIGDEKKSAQSRKMTQVFLPEKGDVSRLVRRGKTEARVGWRVEGKGRLFMVHQGGQLTSVLGEPGRWLPALYVPSREVLSMYEGFIAAYQSRELSFDETFFDLCVALNANVLRGERAEQIAPLLQRLEAIIGGKVLLEGNRFYVQPTNGDRVEAHLVAEGLRKIATIARLVANGGIAPGGVLFWDEPETNLNPRLITQVVDVLIELARHGVQIVLATHDYLLSHRLSLLAEYDKVPPGTVRFFGLARSEPDGPVTVSRGDTLADLPSNPIVEEFARHYDFERELFDHSQGG